MKWTEEKLKHLKEINNEKKVQRYFSIKKLVDESGSPEYQELGELIATMKEVVHREYFSGIKETVVIESIEAWMNEAAKVARQKMKSGMLAVVQKAKTGWYEEGEGIEVEYSAEEMRSQLLANIKDIV